MSHGLSLFMLRIRIRSLSCALTILAGVVGAACGGQGDHDGRGGANGEMCPTGFEACPCYGNQTCEAGLTCASNRCVFAGSGSGGGRGGAGGLSGAGGDEDGSGAGGRGAVDGSVTGGAGAGGTSASTISFYCNLNCSGGIVVYMGARPPQTTGSDVITWTASSGIPSGDQLWTYDHATRVLVNEVSHLALRKRAAGMTLELGASATDGTPLTLISRVGGTYSLMLDDGNVIGLEVGNCPGGLYEVVAPGTPRYVTDFGVR